jgi:iron complex transport system substrate-binding protein
LDENRYTFAAAKVPLVVVPDHHTGPGIVEKVRLVAEAVEAAVPGQCLVKQVEADLAALRDFEAGIGKRKRVLFVLSFVNGRAMVSGRKTAAAGIIELAGAENAITEYEGYKPISDEALVAARPDVVLVMERPGSSDLTADTVFTRPAFGATPAAATRSFVSMEGLYLLGFGPRSARAARDLAVALYPDLKPSPLPSERTAAPADACARQ